MTVVDLPRGEPAITAFLNCLSPDLFYAQSSKLKVHLCYRQ